MESPAVLEGTLKQRVYRSKGPVEACSSGAIPLVPDVDSSNLGDFSHLPHVEGQPETRYDHSLQSDEARFMQLAGLTSLSQLVSTLYHEIQNTLAIVGGYSELLLGDVKDELARDDLHIITDGTKRASRIVEELFSFFRPRTLEKSLLDVKGPLERVLRLHSNQLRVHHIKMVNELSAPLPLTVADEHQLAQLFLNLVVNAEQAMSATGEGGTLTVRGSANSGQIRITIQDDGPGIMPEHRNEIFEPFFTTRPLGKGIGLGLTICRCIVKGHGGRIMVDTQPGRGTAFHVELPVISSPSTVAVRPATATAGSVLNPQRVLVVNDERLLTELISATLSARGHLVDSCSDATTALEAIRHGFHDVIIVDVETLQAGWKHLYQEVYCTSPHLAQRMVFTTGDATGPEELQFIKNRRVPLLQKPFGLADLENIVERVQEAPRGPVPDPYRGI